MGSTMAAPPGPGVGEKRAEIYTYEAPWLIYAVNWSVSQPPRTDPYARAHPLSSLKMLFRGHSQRTNNGKRRARGLAKLDFVLQHADVSRRTRRDDDEPAPRFDIVTARAAALRF